MHRFFIESNQIEENHINIRGQDVKHIRDVLRLREGDEIEAVCHGINYFCQIDGLSKDEVIAKIISKKQGKSEPSIEIVLYQGLAKGNRMDFIIQKGTEIGIKEFQVVATKRSVVKIRDGKKEESRINRLQAIGEEAAKQAKRDYIPEVKGILSFDDMIDILKDEENVIVPYESEDDISIGESLKDIRGKQIHLIIGPEGGFADEEIAKLQAIDAKIVTLGPRILRTETAGIVASTIILYELGNLGVI